MNTPRSEVLDRVGNSTTRVYLYLLSQADPAGWVRRTSRRRIAMQLGLSAPVASRSIAVLEEHGGLKVEADPVNQHSIDVQMNPDGGTVPLVRLGQGEYARDFGGDS